MGRVMPGQPRASQPADHQRSSQPCQLILIGVALESAPGLEMQVQLRVVPSRWRATVVDDLGIPRLRAGAQQDPARVMARDLRLSRIAVYALCGG
jgi:hypothetical protein